MVTRLLVQSSNAVYFVENETVRGLIVLISEAGLSLGPLLSSKKSLTESVRFHLDRGTLAVLQVKFRDRTGQNITTGYGLWSFYVKYDAFGRGSVELPVNTMLGDLRRNPHALKGVASYTVLLWVRAGASAAAGAPVAPDGAVHSVCELSPDWDKKPAAAQSGPANRYVGSFGWDALRVSIYRE